MQKQFQAVKMDVKNGNHGRFLSPGFELSWKPKIDKYCIFCWYLYVLIGWCDGHDLLFFFSLTVNEIVRFIFEESSASLFLWEQRRMKLEKSFAFVSLHYLQIGRVHCRHYVTVWGCNSSSIIQSYSPQFEFDSDIGVEWQSNGICVEVSPDLAHD